VDRVCYLWWMPKLGFGEHDLYLLVLSCWYVYVTSSYIYIYEAYFAIQTVYLQI
jgi:hypothetical protein